MKKIIILICLFSFFTIPCSAKEITEKQAPVYARCIDNSYIGYGSELENGGASVNIDNGINVTVSGVNTSQKLELIVMPITEKTDGYSWFKDVLSKHGEKIMPFDIYFLNQNGEKITANTNFQVTITIPKGFSNPKIYSIDTNGNTAKINSSVNNNISFTANNNGYYSIIDITKDSSETPQTGDNSSVILIFVLLGVSAIGILVAIKKRLDK